MYKYKMISNRVDRFQAGELFAEQLIDSLNAEPLIFKVVETDENKDLNKQASNATDEAKEESGKIHIEL